MCGIGGFVWTGRGAAAFDREHRLRKMIDVLRHRGPDDAGTWTDRVCGLAHTRLSIIDLSPAGHQPMSSRDGRVWVSFNGDAENIRQHYIIERELADRLRHASREERRAGLYAVLQRAVQASC